MCRHLYNVGFLQHYVAALDIHSRQGQMVEELEWNALEGSHIYDTASEIMPADEALCRLMTTGRLLLPYYRYVIRNTGSLASQLHLWTQC